MEPLRPADPSRVGRYRLLGRLGAGGMGVVFLARSPGGAVAAVKVIRAVHADDEGFRARFRREVAAARRVDSPWVVPLLHADPDAPAPWLATAFVPGPSLAEVLEAHGPLPDGTVRVLGARLAEALEAVHRAGLVHRDVKPGNVLLSLDGPRLIDFGIARAPDGTALTSSGVIIGSPGFLSPEQAQARGGAIGPPSDVFSLGCVLAFAVSGVRPFGGGASAGMLLRTVYEDPDLQGVPDGLESLLRTCLDKDPALRPTAASLRQELDAAAGSGPAGVTHWLPEAVTRLIADRSATVLAVGAIEPTQVASAPDPAPDPGRPADGSPAYGTSPATPGPLTPGAVPHDAATVTAVPVGGAAPRGGPSRRVLLSTASAAALAAGGTALWWATGRNRRAAPTGDRPALAIAFHGDLSGPHKDVGRAERDGARLAVEQLNAGSAQPFTLDLSAYDDAGDPARAASLARRIVADRAVLAVLGPTTDAGLAAVEKTYTTAVMPLLSVSVGTGAHVGGGATTSVFRSHAALQSSDDLMSAPCVKYLVGRVDARRVMLVDDRAQGDFSWILCDYIRRALLPGGRSVTLRTIPAGRLDPRALAAEAVAARSDAVVFAGDAERAGALAAALASARFTGARMATQRAFGPAFLRTAGAAADGWVFATTFIDPSAEPAARAFTAAYRERFGTTPYWYAAEAYDAVRFLAEALDVDGGPLAERGAIARRLREISHKGISRDLAYHDEKSGYTMDALFLFEVKGGRFRYLGQYAEAIG
ncbi:bifunctional serine/threonine-protein kinase/ABC transporter substrate-binding protein [Streptomyces sp. SP18CS02]|uniref:bifunctional serine/threonine-protein kinase/ABC transporter substrate-binding protein n=1 Tax=Streptomyces sp. SP18CS02 TaxID=3002531 RepID=UPI002E76D6EC|nr:ABC transporter substrate-binding protein [Streptomyces sp. SP18CS02]MEE1757513.1 ABC transporter substrate-binding protein [Streptomyces sp. SP18CS02]